MEKNQDQVHAAVGMRQSRAVDYHHSPKSQKVQVLGYNRAFKSIY